MIDRKLLTERNGDYVIPLLKVTVRCHKLKPNNYCGIQVK